MYNKLRMRGKVMLLRAIIMQLVLQPTTINTTIPGVICMLNVQLNNTYVLWTVVDDMDG